MAQQIKKQVRKALPRMPTKKPTGPKPQLPVRVGPRLSGALPDKVKGLVHPDVMGKKKKHRRK